MTKREFLMAHTPISIHAFIYIHTRIYMYKICVIVCLKYTSYFLRKAIFEYAVIWEYIQHNIWKIYPADMFAFVFIVYDELFLRKTFKSDSGGSMPVKNWIIKYGS